jgi:sugar phosphate isomerase/epimerase
LAHPERHALDRIVGSDGLVTKVDLETNWILWTGTLGFDTPFADRIRAATATGFGRITISPSDVAARRAAGRPVTEWAHMARDHGLELVMDPVVNWHPHDGGGPFRAARFTLDDMLGMCAEAGCVAMTAVAMDTSSIPVRDLSQPFAELCDRAASSGVDVHLEFIPMTVINDLAVAWDVVRDANRPNGGIVFDTWHFFRGHPDLDLLTTIPGERIFAVQVDDADPTPHGTLWEDTLRRRLPGDGSFDLDAVLSILSDIGGLRWVGPEVMHPDLAAMDPVDAARLAGDRVRKLVAGAARSATVTDRGHVHGDSGQ